MKHPDSSMLLYQMDTISVSSQGRGKIEGPSLSAPLCRVISWDLPFVLETPHESPSQPAYKKLNTAFRQLVVL